MPTIAMPTIADTIRAALKRPQPTTEQAATTVDLARRADGEARAAVDTASATVAAGFLDPADKRARDRAALAAARETAEDAALALAEAERRLAEASAADEEQRRQAVYAEAKRKADAAALALAKTYPTLVKGIVEMLRNLAEAQQAVGLANRELPAGAAPLADPEQAVRAIPGLPREVVSEEEVVLWAYNSTLLPAPDDMQAAIVHDNKGWGRGPGSSVALFRRRSFTKRTVRDATYGDTPAALAAGIQLPVVHGSGFLWEAATVAWAWTMDSADVLARIAEIDALAVARPAKATRPVRTEWVDHGEVEPPAAEPPVAHDTGRSRFASTGSRFAASPFASPGSRPARSA